MLKDTKSTHTLYSDLYFSFTMKLIIKLLLPSFFFLYSFRSFSQDTVPATCYENEITQINSINPNDTNFSDLYFLKTILANNKIVILGESGHGDGASFEAKTRIIKFLVENMGYRTIAFEGGGFLEMNFAESRIKRGKDVKTEFEKSWYALWSKSKQIQPLFDFFTSKNDLNYWGIENQLGNIYSWNYIPIIDSLIGPDAFKGVNFDTVKADIGTLMRYPYDSNLRKTVSLSKIKTELQIIRNNVENLNLPQSDFVKQAILNIEGTIDANELFYGSHEEYNKSIGIRDSLMASNVLWYLKKNPDEKVIIWTANLHASHNLDEAVYKDDDDFYQTFIPLGQRLKSKYGSEVFSIAMISTEGQSAIWHLPTPYPIEIPESSWDYQLSKVIDYDYAFINFRNIANNPRCRQLKFESTILGYHQHTGNWFNIFDGVFYIRKMYRSDKAIEVAQKH